MPLWIFTILSIIIPLIVSSLFNESILQGLARLLSRIDLPKKTHLKGVWDVHFFMEENGQKKTFKEVVNITESLGFIFGNNIPDQNNHRILATVHHKKPRRIKASIIDNRYVTGTWYHPDRRTRYHGSFQLLLQASSNKMVGIWTGYRESTNIIESGEWVWIKRQ